MSWYSAKELAGLPGMPGTERAIQIRAKREKWEGQPRLGSKAVEYAFAVLPTETQNALLLAQADNAAPTPVSTVAPPPEEQRPGQHQLTDAQRQVMTARVAFVREIERMSKMVTQQRAIETLVAHAQADDLTPYLKQRVVLANDRKTETRTLSERTLKRWIADFKKHGERGLAPKRRQADMSMPEWAGDFLKRYQKPQKPSVEAAYQLLVEQTPPPHPSIHQVRRWLAKLSPEARERGRMGAHESKSLKAFVRRTANELWPNDIWVADGHTFDAEVINPETGQAFRPEVTLIIDWATRRIVGFALNLAESTLATLDALRYSVSRAGMFGTFYVDNGSGFANDTIREVVDRLGGQMTHSLPYNSQARGVIERAHKTILVTLAKTMDSYIGADMDKEAATKAHKLSRRDIKQGLKPAQLPTFQEFYDRLNEALDTYNFRPHRGLPKIRDVETGKLRHQSPMEAWKSAEAEGFEALTAPADVVASLMRPQLVRKTHRGEVRVNSGIYFLPELVNFHGEEVRVGWDYRDVGQVGVFTLEGEIIGEALLDGNATPAMPVAVVQKGRERRQKGQFAKLAQKGKTLTGKDVEIRVIEPVSQASEQQQERKIAHARAHLKQLEAEGKPFQLPNNKVERWRLWNKLDAQLKRGEDVPEEAREWHKIYRDNRDLKAIAEAMDTDGRPPVRNPWAK
ncbi:DNA-binding protein [Halomonas sp. M1]|uniref:DNA-binding protein n=1 Tax=Halomonas sp. M1 TaxID=3035470 RepID=UPI0024859313|nr:DNA-binding protein [Halomonas sp. M1]WFE73077.1 DNA-binding protein [Halomonas sp. M1]